MHFCSKKQKQSLLMDLKGSIIFSFIQKFEIFEKNQQNPDRTFKLRLKKFL